VNLEGRRYYLILFLLFVLSFSARYQYAKRIGGSYFHAESASHLRYTRMIAEGKGIPDVDRLAQWPEGLTVKEETSIFMEYFYGLCYRLFGGGASLEGFLRLVIPLFFSFALFPVANVSSLIWGSRGAGIISGFLFAVALPLVARSSGFEYIREDFAVPLIILHLYFFILSIDDWHKEGVSGLENTGLGSGLSKRLVYTILSGVFLFLALASWQGTQFYLVPFSLILLVRSIFSHVPSESRKAEVLFVAIIIAGFLVIPYLKHSGGIFSVPLSILLAWLVVNLVATFDSRGRSGGRPVGAWGKRHWIYLLPSAVFVFVIFSLLVLSSKTYISQYSHFLSMIIYKLRFLEKPADPRVLPFDVRTFWVGPFNAPDALHFFIFALPLTFLLPVPISLLFKMIGKGKFSYLFVLYFLFVSFVLFMLIQRMIWLYGLFAVIVAGGMIYEIRGSEIFWGRVNLPRIFFVLIAIVMITQDYGWEGKVDFWRELARRFRIPRREKFVIYPYSRDVEGELFRWIKENIPEDAPIISLHYLSPQILTYTGRATVLNDFFESSRLRKKAQGFLSALYSNEENLYDFCRSYKARYLLVSSAVGCDPTKDSPMYQAGLLTLPQKSAAFKFMFEPDSLDYFRLVYENEMYRVFQIGASPLRANWPRSPLFYEQELLWKAKGDIRSFYNSVMRIYAKTARGGQLLRVGKYSEAESELLGALRLYYFYPAWYLLDTLYRKGGKLKDKDMLAHFAYKYDPNRVIVCIAEIEALIREERVDEALRVLEHTWKLPMSGNQKKKLKKLEDVLKGEAH